MADYLKRALEKLALACEQDADRLATLSQAKRVEAGDVDKLKTTDTHEELAKRHKELMENLSSLEKAKSTHDTEVESNKKIEAQIAELIAQNREYDVEALQLNVAKQEALVESLRARLDAAEKALQSAKDELKPAEDFVKSLRN